MVDPIVVKLAKKFGTLTVSYSAKALLSKISTPDKRLAEAWEISRKDFCVALGIRLQRLIDDFGDFQCRVDERTSDRAIGAAMFEAVRATNQERIELLASAVAGFVSADLDEQLRHRAYRIVLDLELSDVICLRELRDWESRKRTEWDVWGAANAAKQNPSSTPAFDHPTMGAETFQIEFAVLQAAGCICGLTGFPPHTAFASQPPILNELGHAVLRLLAADQTTDAQP